MADYSTWLTKQQAADALAVTTKTVEAWAQAKKLEQAFWRRPTGGPALAVYNPDDVARLASERHAAPAPFVLPATPASGNGHGRRARAEEASQALALPRPTSTGEDLVREFLGALLRAGTPTSSENSEKLFLSIPEAAAASGLSRTCLRRLITDGKLAAIRDRGWRIRRRDLEQL